MSDLLRETGLLVATLRAGGHPASFDSLRARCKELLERFREALDRREYSRDVCDEALVAQCALLDEAALHHLSGVEQDRWAARPLQVETFGKHDTGESVFMRLDDRMRESTPHVELLECYATILGLGFVGRYAIEGEAKRQVLLADLGTLLARSRPATATSVLMLKGGRPRGWLKRTSPWLAAVLACAVAALVWFAWHVSLDARLVSHLSQLPSKPTTP